MCIGILTLSCSVIFFSHGISQPYTSLFFHLLVNGFALLLIIIIIFINFFRWVFSECTEANATSLVPLDTILPEKCAFIIGFRCTVWNKMRSLTGSLVDGVLADAILIPFRSPILPTNIRKVRGPQKTYGN